MNLYEYTNKIMFLTKVVPLSKIPRPAPQILSYFTSYKLKKGTLVTISLRKRNVKAIVFGQEDVLSKKIEIKKSEFKLKPILKVNKEEPVIDENQLKLAEWLSEYYWASLGKTLSLFLRQPKNKIENENIAPKNSQKKEPELIIAPLGYFPKKEIKSRLKKNQEVLFLVPEKEKEDFWRTKLKNFSSHCLNIGTRSSLFRPFKNLGLIVLTEEENKNYKSEMEPKYNTKKVAEKLAKIWNAKIIIISSFPSVETYATTKITKKIKEDKPKQKIIIDMKEIKPWQPISPYLLEEINKIVKKKEKIILFLNRRGVATTLLCQDCGWIQKCDNCDVPVVYHFKSNSNKNPITICHYCGAEKLPVQLCKNCKSWNLTILGSGIQKAMQELEKIFGKEKILRLDSEITKNKEEQEKTLETFFKKKVPILITTSVIFKYLPFKKVPTVGIISIDSMLSLPDFKIEEECAKMVEGLLSMCEKKFIIQTFFPNSKAVSWISKDKKDFLKKTLKERKRFSYPPFSSLIKLSIFNKSRKTVMKDSYQLKRNLEAIILKNKINAEIVGPASAFIEKIRNQYQWKLLIKIKTKDQRLKNCLLGSVPPHWKVDIDPIKII